MKGRRAPGDTCPAAPSIAPRGSSGVTPRLGGGPRPDPVVRLTLIVSRVWVSFCVVSPPSPTPTPSSDAGGGHLRDPSHNAVGGSAREVYPSGAEAVPDPPVLAGRLPGPSDSPLTVRAQPEGTGARPPRCFCPRASHVVPDSDQSDPSRTLAVHRPFRARPATGPSCPAFARAAGIRAIAV